MDNNKDNIDKTKKKSTTSKTNTTRNTKSKSITNKDINTKTKTTTKKKTTTVKKTTTKAKNTASVKDPKKEVIEILDYEEKENKELENTVIETIDNNDVIIDNSAIEYEKNNKPVVESVAIKEEEIKILDDEPIIKQEIVNDNKETIHMEKSKEIVKKKKHYHLRFVIGKILFTIVFVGALVSLGYSLYKIFNWQQDNKKIEEIEKEIEIIDATKEVADNENTTNVNPPEDEFDPYWDYIKMNLLEVDFSELIKQNEDTVGWIKVDNTNINYPVVQASNNDYYLTHDYSESWNDAGWIFMDYRNNSDSFGKNTIIYGHSRLDKSMFGTLRNITNRDWFNNKDNHIIKFSTPKENTLWQVFSVYTIEAEDYYIKTDFSDKDFNTWIKEMHNRSIYNFKTSVNKNDKVLTLSSCYTTTGIRVVLHAKLIKSTTR